MPTACHVKSRCMSPSAISEAPATQNDLACNQGGRHQVPRLPRKVPRRHRRQIRTKRATQYHECHACHAKRRWMRVLCHACHVKRGCDVTKCHACHAKCRGVTGDKSGPSAPPSTMSATPATQNDGGCEFVPRLPRETKVDVTKCHACPRKVPRRHRRQIRTKRATQYHECHACHAKRRWMRVCATPAT